MIRRITMLVAAALMVLALAAPAAFAVSAAERQCEDVEGGTFTRVGPGQYECVVTDTSSGPTPGTGNDPQTFEDTDTQPQQGQGVGGGAQGEETTLHCEYSNSGKLFENKSDEGCPATL
jgi:hypothetical protein